MRYRILIVRAAEREMDRLPERVHRRISARILGLETQPRPSGCRKLRGGDGWRIRVGDYRVLYLVDEATRTVTIEGVLHRSIAYR